MLKIDSYGKTGRQAGRYTSIGSLLTLLQAFPHPIHGWRLGLRDFGSLGARLEWDEMVWKGREGKKCKGNEMKGWFGGWMDG